MTSRRPTSPVGASHRDRASRRARNPEYAAQAARLEPFEALARLVIRRRTELELSQEELAARMGTSHSAISRIESGQHATSVNTLRRLAAALESQLVVGFADVAEGDTTASVDPTRTELVPLP